MTYWCLTRRACRCGCGGCGGGGGGGLLYFYITGFNVFLLSKLCLRVEIAALVRAWRRRSPWRSSFTRFYCLRPYHELPYTPDVTEVYLIRCDLIANALGLYSYRCSANNAEAAMCGLNTPSDRGWLIGVSFHGIDIQIKSHMKCSIFSVATLHRQFFKNCLNDENSLGHIVVKSHENIFENDITLVHALFVDNCSCMHINSIQSPLRLQLRPRAFFA